MGEKLAKAEETIGELRADLEVRGVEQAAHEAALARVDQLEERLTAELAAAEERRVADLAAQDERVATAERKRDAAERYASALWEQIQNAPRHDAERRKRLRLAVLPKGPHGDTSGDSEIFIRGDDALDALIESTALEMGIGGLRDSHVPASEIDRIRLRLATVISPLQSARPFVLTQKGK